MNNPSAVDQKENRFNNVKEYNLTNPQVGIWYAEQFYPESGLNNIAGTLHYDEGFDYDILNQAFNEFVRTHDGVRLRIRSDNGDIKQYIADYTPAKIDFLDFSEKNENEFLDWEREQTRSPIFGEDNDLYYFCMLKLPDDKSGFFLKFHHIISDAWSTVMVGDQIIHLYTKMVSKQEYQMDPSPSYTEFIEKDDQYNKSERCAKDKEYWMKEFEDVPEVASLKVMKRKNVSIAADRKSFYLPEKLIHKLRSYSEEHNKSLFALFLSAMAIYMNRVTEKEDLVIGVPSLNRSGPTEKSMFGMFVTTIPIVLSVPPGDSYSKFSDDVALKWRNVLRHHKYSVSQILRDIRENNPGIEKLFDIVISYQNARFSKDDIEESFNSDWHFQGEQSESLYVHINDREDEGRILIDYDYWTDVYYGKDIEAIHDHFIRILWHTLDAAPDRKISDIEMVSENEKKLILQTFNDTDADFPRNSTMIDFFNERARKYPEETALFFGDMQMKYKDIDKQSDRLAKTLIKRGVTRNVVVGIVFTRCFEMMISILAIWKAGGAYMPIDPNAPKDRVDYMIENSGAEAILSIEPHINSVDVDEETVHLIDVAEHHHAHHENESIEEHRPQPEDLAYVIYTSGSTGKPKGVMNEHRALVNRINWMQKKYPVDGDDMILQKTTYTFDVSVWGLTWWFYAGAKMVFLDPGEEKNPGAIISAIEQYEITTMHFVPSMLGAFLTYLESSDERVLKKIRSLKRVFASGEALTVKQTERFNNLLNKANSTTLHNLYGPTEAAIDVSYYDCPEVGEFNSVPIGKPIDNIQLYIVNKYFKLQPINVPGELCIAGVGLARGYVNNEELTNEKFVDNPFEPGTKMYRTGDLARWYPRGDIEYLGRIDSQIKIRGFRVELGEIQAHIMNYGKFDNAVVTSVADNNGNMSICAYILPKDNKEPSIDDLNTYLKSKLPEYMLPQNFMVLDNLPLLSNGKVNFHALPKPEVTVTSAVNSISPRNETESEIYSVWCTVLGKSNFGVTDDFFSGEVGGDSLRAIEVVSMLPKMENSIIDITDFYQNPTIEELAAYFLCDEEGLLERKKRRSSILLELSTNIEESGSSDDNITYICCPYGGGSAYVYAQLANSLKLIHSDNNEHCSVYSVNLPRRDLNSGEQIFVDSETVADRIMTEVRTNEKIAKSKIIVYGHCVGNALALKLLRKLENENFNILCLFAGGLFPPKWIKYYPGDYDPWKRFKDESVLNYLLDVGFPEGDINDETKADMMSAFRFDVREYYKYMKDSEKEIRNPLESPIISIVGDIDKMTKGYERKYKNFSKFTYGKVSLLVINGAKHYFVKTHTDILSKKLRDKLIEDGFMGGYIFADTAN